MILSDKDIKRFWSKVDVRGPDDCWPWLAGKTKFGHGVFSVKHKWIAAHRISFFIKNGYLPNIATNHLVMHDCEYAACQNPNHLLDGTIKQNGNYPGHIRKQKSQIPYWLGCKGVQSPRYGKKHTAETKRKLSELALKREARKRLKLVPRHENLLVFRTPQ